MVRPAPFVAAPYKDILSEFESAENRPSDRIMADLALAFSLDIDLANEQAAEEKWPAGRTAMFVVLSCAALWALIAGLIFVII